MPFNPYHQWLELPDNCWSPDHYQLLGLALFEDDVPTIRAAADRALAKVRSFRPGHQAEAWSKLLDHIAEAKKILQDPRAKSAYDSSLRASALAEEQEAEEGSSTPADPAQGHPEVALVNLRADLYPPGMAPETDQGSISSSARPSAAGRSMPPARSVVPPQPSKQSAAPRANRSPTTDGGAREGSEKFAPSRSKGPMERQLDTPIPPGPVNAHVAPPRREPSSSLPTMLVITAVLVIVTLLIMFVALRDPAATSTAVPRNDAGADIDLARDSSRFGVEQQPADGSVMPFKSRESTRKKRQERPASKQAPDEPSSAAGDEQPIATGVGQDGTWGTADETANEQRDAKTGAGSGSNAAPRSSQPSDARKDVESALSTGSPQFVQAITDARQALRNRAFDEARAQLSAAESLAKREEQQRRVHQMTRLISYAERFWQTVTDTGHRLKGLEELSMGGGQLVVIVVETTPQSITIRRQGRNETYAFTQMPAGLALAIARLVLDVESAEDLIVLGAGLVSGPKMTPGQLEKALEYWQRAAALGADVEDLRAVVAEPLGDGMR